jgi:hypothetical protein
MGPGAGLTEVPSLRLAEAPAPGLADGPAALPVEASGLGDPPGLAIDEAGGLSAGLALAPDEGPGLSSGLGDGVEPELDPHAAMTTARESRTAENGTAADERPPRRRGFMAR